MSRLTTRLTFGVLQPGAITLRCTIRPTGSGGVSGSPSADFMAVGVAGAVGDGAVTGSVAASFSTAASSAPTAMAWGMAGSGVDSQEIEPGHIITHALRLPLVGLHTAGPTIR